MPTTAHVPDAWIMGFDLNPLETLAAKQQFAKGALERKTLVLFAHDPTVVAGHIQEEDGKRRIVPASGTP
jgi:hypothetical protein